MASPSFQNSVPNRTTAYPFSQADHLAKPQSYPSDSVTQAELLEFLDLSQQAKELADRRDECRARLIAQLTRNLPVERGARRAKLILREARYLSAKSLLPLLGKQHVERLKNQGQPTLSFLLKVF